MKRTLSIFPVLIILAWNASQAQINISAVAGGGISDLHTGFPLSDNSTTNEFLVPGMLLQAGAALNSTFQEDGKLSWEAQILLRRSTLRNVPIDWVNADCTDLGDGITICHSPFPRDYNNVYKWNYWSINIPASLNFQVFGPIGWKIGGNINYLLSKFPEEDKIKINGGNPNLNTKFDSFSWQGHTGFFGIINPRIRIEALVFSDFKPRLTHGGQILDDGTPADPEYRAMGLFVNAIYRLN